MARIQLLPSLTDTRQVAGHAFVKAHNALGKVVDGADENQGNGSDDKRVLDQVLAVLLAKEGPKESFHGVAPFDAWTGEAAGPCVSGKKYHLIHAKGTRQTPGWFRTGTVAGLPSNSETSLRF